jgi:hypothetical protein
MAIRGTDRNPESWHGRRHSCSGAARGFAATWMNGANARIHFADGAVSYDDIQVTRD